MEIISFSVDSRTLFDSYREFRQGSKRCVKVRGHREWCNWLTKRLCLVESADFILSEQPGRAGKISKVLFFTDGAAAKIMEFAEYPDRFNKGIIEAKEQHKRCLETGIKTCSTCRIDKPIDQFRLIRKKNGDFFESYCNACYLTRKRNCSTERYKTLAGSLLVQWNNIQTRSRKKGTPCDIDIEFLVGLWEKQCGRCFYSGLRMTYVRVPRAGRLRHGRTNPSMLSVDRLDSTKGYTRDNVVLCRWDVNFMKNELSVDQFKSLVFAIARHLRKMQKNKKNGDHSQLVLSLA